MSPLSLLLLLVGLILVTTLMSPGGTVIGWKDGRDTSKCKGLICLALSCGSEYNMIMTGL